MITNKNFEDALKDIKDIAGELVDTHTHSVAEGQKENSGSY